MYFSPAVVALVASLSTASAQGLKGFNWGATHTDNSPMTESDYESQFKLAQGLTGAPGFTSARLYTSIQAGTASDYSSAFQAAINTNTKLLLGVWGSAGSTIVDNEVTALTSAIKTFGSKLASLVVGVSVGSEDLYRSSELGIQAKAGIGADPTTIANYISQVKKALSGTALGSVPVGHVDTWTAWYNTSNNAVIDNSDFIGVDAYPYFQNTMSNPIGSGKALFDQAIANVKSTTKGKQIWVTETGWPVSGPNSNEAIANVENAKTYWDEVGCGELFGNVNTWWYTLQDALPSTPSPSFGLIAGGSTTPLFDLSCSNITSQNSTSSAVSSVTGSVTASATDAGSPGITGFSSLDASAASATMTQVPTVVTMTNSAGSTLATTIMTNQTVAATGTPMSPTASTTGPSGSVSTGGAVAKIGSAAGALGAALAVVFAL